MSLPLIGCVAAVAIKKAVASHDAVVKDEKEVEIGPSIVAMTVESIHVV